MFDQHLSARQLSLGPGAEWSPPQGWSVVHLAGGICYWKHPHASRELVVGSVLILSASAGGAILASQLGEARLDLFMVEPSRLASVVTLSEQTALQKAALNAEPSFRLFEPGTPLAARFGSLFGKGKGSPRRLRLQLLSLFLGAVLNDLAELAEMPQCSPRERLEALLRRMPEERLLKLEFADLARQVACSRRHLGRLFGEVTGMTFRQKQAEARLSHARELLATSELKVREVAPQCGFGSLSLFTHMFKRRFGVTPAKWRRLVPSKPAPAAVGGPGVAGGSLGIATEWRRASVADNGAKQVFSANLSP